MLEFFAFLQYPSNFSSQWKIISEKAVRKYNNIDLRAFKLNMLLIWYYYGILSETEQITCVKTLANFKGGGGWPGCPSFLEKSNAGGYESMYYRLMGGVPRPPPSYKGLREYA